MDILRLQLETIKELLDWRVSLDILLIAMGIFFLYHTLRATGTWKIVLGIMIAAAVFVAARLLDLRGIDWIYSNLSQVLLIALIIIFQPELRKIFERAAASLSRQEIGREGPQLSELISKAVFTMAQKRCGAVLVFPGNDAIQSWISEGIPLDARPSVPVLLSIFDPNSPGHDGAAVIENQRITSFGVRLPLSRSGALSHDYGTRHHAGMGLAENTDALVVVVSEERGTVTMFSEGTYEVVSDEAALARRIVDHWQDRGSYDLLDNGDGNQKRVITELAVSFLLAFFFWSTVVLTQTQLQEVSYAVPVEYLGQPENLVLVGEKPEAVRVHLLAPVSELSNVNPANLRLFADLSEASAGLNTLPIRRENLLLPDPVRFLRSEPARLELEFTEIEEVTLGVEPQLIGALPPGWRLASVEVTPAAMRARIPRTNGGTQVRLTTSPIFLETIRATTTLYCGIVAPPHIQPVNGAWPNVEVRLILERVQ